MGCIHVTKFHINKQLCIAEAKSYDSGHLCQRTDCSSRAPHCDGAPHHHHQLLVNSHGWLENTGLTQTVVFFRDDSAERLAAGKWMHAFGFVTWSQYFILLPCASVQATLFLSLFQFLSLIMVMLAGPANTFPWHPVYFIFTGCVPSIEVIPVSYLQQWSAIVNT